MAFIPDSEAHTLTRHAGRTLTHGDYSHAMLASIDARLTDSDVGVYVRPCESFAEWARHTRVIKPRVRTVSYVRVPSFEQWAADRTHDAVIAQLRAHTAQAHTRTRSHGHTLTLADGTRTHTHSHDDTLTRAAHIAWRRVARRMRRVSLKSTAYRGTLTRDGMSLGATNTANRVANLDRAIALSDAFFNDGTLALARNVIRHDDGTVDAASTLLAANLKHRRTK